LVSNGFYPIIFWLFLIIIFQVFLSLRKNRFLGLLIPLGFLFLAGYNLFKSLYVSNPRPTMAEGIYMTLGLFGIGVFGLVYLICRSVLWYQNKRRIK